MKRSYWLLGVACLATGTGLGLEWRTQQNLLLQRDTALETQRTRATLAAENARLSASLPSAAEWDVLLAAAEEAARLRRSAPPTDTPTPPDPTPFSSLSDPSAWSASPGWINRGASTSAAAVETTLWAAANAELSVLRDLIELTPEARAQAEAILARLSPEARARYAGPEDLAALFTARDALFEGAQLVYNQSIDADHSQAALIARTADGKSKEISVNLHRVNDMWRLVMPVTAMNRIAAELSGTTARLKPDVATPRRSP